MIRTLETDFEALKRDILELKTAQTKPSTFSMDRAFGPISAGRYTRGFYFWKIHYSDVGDTNPPITIFNWGSNWALRNYSSVDNTQEVEFYSNGLNIYFVDTSFIVYSSRPIAYIEQLTAPQPLEEWTQVRDFYPQDMGTTPGWCLQNCRLGFHIYSGTFTNAVSDMQSQRNNGTLHPFNGATETPPDYIACPVYINIAGVADGHVCVWDHGTIWNDGYTVAKFTDMGGYIEVWGWGELCDGARVVQHI